MAASSSIGWNHIRGVVFDMDGVLIDSHPAHREAWRTFLRTLQLDVDDNELNYILDGRRREDILRHFLGNLSAEQLWRYGRQKDAFFAQQVRRVAPTAGLLGFLVHLQRQRIPLAIATSASETRTYATLERLRLRRFFKAILTANDVEASKPDPTVYLRACHLLAVAPGLGLAIEDSFSGVRSAKGAGLRCVVIPGKQDATRLLAAGADLVIRDFVGIRLADLERSLHRGQRYCA
jgi:HAD superfamily hydrolase (TIGR01509 family)